MPPDAPSLLPVPVRARPVPAPTSPTIAARMRAAEKIHRGSGAPVVALAGVDLDIEAGTFTAVMGPSGSGKSTLLHCLAGLDPLTSGQVVVGGVDLSTLSDRALTQLRRDRIGFVFQAYNLVPSLTTVENIELPSRLARRRVDPVRLREVVHATGLGDRVDHRPSELSGGEQQRVAVARALHGRPALIIADEPTGNLDTVASAAILDLLRAAVTDHDQTVVMVTHDAAAASVADRVVFLVDGRIVDEVSAPTTADVLDRMKRLGSR